MNKDSESKRCATVGQKLLGYDRFGEKYGLRLDDGKDALPSKMGTVCSIVLLIILVAYTGYKVSILGGKKSVDILQAVSKHHFDSDHAFGGEQGLNFAI